MVQIIAAVADSPAAYKLADGRLVVTAFDANLNPPPGGHPCLSQLKSQGINVAFVPTFLGWSSYASTYSSISYGFADWGTATRQCREFAAGRSRHSAHKVRQDIHDAGRSATVSSKDFAFWKPEIARHFVPDGRPRSKATRTGYSS